MRGRLFNCRINIYYGCIHYNQSRTIIFGLFSYLHAVPAPQYRLITVKSIKDSKFIWISVNRNLFWFLLVSLKFFTEDYVKTKFSRCSNWKPGFLLKTPGILLWGVNFRNALSLKIWEIPIAQSKKFERTGHGPEKQKSCLTPLCQVSHSYRQGVT